MATDWKAMPIAAGELIIALDDDADLSEREWTGFVDTLKAAAARHDGQFDKVFVLVVTDGGTTSPAQRAYLAQALEGQSLRVAVLSDSLRVRGTVHAVGWVLRQVRFFGPDEAREWLEHVPLTKAERVAVRREILQLQRTIRTKTVARIEPWLAD